MSTTRTRHELLDAISERLSQQTSNRVLKVAIDGVDGAGKTTFADELAATLTQQGQAVIRASIDGFHNPRDIRYRLGRSSPEGYYRDSYNYAALRSELLDPLRPGGSGLYRTQVFDHTTDQPVHTAQRQAQGNEILLLDGLFLHRPELRAYWDDSVFLKVDFDLSVPRGASRGPGFGSPDPHAESNRRYVEGNRLYFAEAHPEEQAGIVINNNDLNAPFIENIRPV